MRCLRANGTPHRNRHLFERASERASAQASSPLARAHNALKFINEAVRSSMKPATGSGTIKLPLLIVEDLATGRHSWIKARLGRLIALDGIKDNIVTLEDTPPRFSLVPSHFLCALSLISSSLELSSPFLGVLICFQLSSLERIKRIKTASAAKGGHQAHQRVATG